MLETTGTVTVRPTELFTCYVITIAHFKYTEKYKGSLFGICSWVSKEIPTVTVHSEPGHALWLQFQDFRKKKTVIIIQ
jgi:hypothetical protein